MKCNKAPLVALLFAFLIQFSVNELFAAKPKVVIREMKKVKATGIILSEADMTRMVFDEIEKLSNFMVIYTPRDGEPEIEADADLIISGKYELEGDLISISYEIRSIQPKMRFKQSVVKVALETVKQQLLTNFLDLFPKFVIISEPSEATVQINGVEFGKTPLTVDNLINGEHLITIGKEGYFSSNIELLEIEDEDTLRAVLTEQTMMAEVTPPYPDGGMSKIYKTIQYHKDVLNHPFFKQRGFSGEIILAVEVSENGEVKDVKIVQSFGDEIIDNAAIDGVRSVKWNPAMQDGKPVDGRNQIKLRFRSNR